MKHIKVKVFPSAKEDTIIKKSEDSFEIKVREKPQNGLANIAVKKVLSSYLGVPENKIFLVKGHKERSKIFQIN